MYTRGSRFINISLLLLLLSLLLSLLLLLLLSRQELTVKTLIRGGPPNPSPCCALRNPGLFCPVCHKCRSLGYLHCPRVAVFFFHLLPPLVPLSVL